MTKSDKKCKFIKVDGERCGAWHIKGSPYCHFHDPTNKDVHKDVSAKGGKGNLPVLTEKELPDIMKLRDTESILVFNEVIIHYALTGKIHHDIVKVVNGIVANQIRLVEFQVALIRNPLPSERDEPAIEHFESANGEYDEAAELVNELARHLEDKGIEL